MHNSKVGSLELLLPNTFIQTIITIMELLMLISLLILVPLDTAVVNKPICPIPDAPASQLVNSFDL